MVNFEVIGNLDEKDPYTVLLGIEWVYDNDAIANLKNGNMTLKLDGMQFLQHINMY